MRGGDGASTDVPIAPRDASDGRVSGLVYQIFRKACSLHHQWTNEEERQIHAKENSDEERDNRMKSKREEYTKDER